MHVKRESTSDTSVTLTVTADQAIIDEVKRATLSRLKKDVRVPGFRPGKAPLALIEKHISPSVLQSEFLDSIVNHLYVDAVTREELRPVAQPEITLSKFVPYTTLEFIAKVETVGEVSLPDYKKIKVAMTKAEITAKDVDQVVENLRARSATKKPVERASKLDDEVLIDFSGVDAKTKEPIAGADGTEYPLLLGSGTFIPGFEDKLVDFKPGSETEFELTFPKNYNVPSLQNRNVIFKVQIRTVSSVIKPKLDDAFAASVGPFKTVAELKGDVKKQLKQEKEREVRQIFDNELLQKITEKSKVAIPKSLIEEEIDRIEEEEKRNITYRGQTWQEHLSEEGITAEEHREKQREAATLRVKSGLVLSEVAKKELVRVTPEELEIRIQLLKGQYPDQSMQAELDKPENRRDIMNRMVTEKTLDKLRDYSLAIK